MKNKPVMFIFAVVLCLIPLTAASGQRIKKRPVKPKMVTKQIFNGSVAVSKLQWFPFFVSAYGATVFGRFEAQGGTKADIECFIVNEDGLTNLKNGNQAETYYNSGVVTVANINRFIADEGYYYLVFRNPSIWTNRNVFGTVSYKWSNTKPY